MRAFAPARATPAGAAALPIPWLGAIEEADNERFFGRDSAVEEALGKLWQHPFLAIIGPSGCGKSSLVRAGLLPALLLSGLFGAGGWRLLVVRPGNDPDTALANALGCEVPASRQRP